MYFPKNTELLSFSKWKNYAAHIPFGFLDFDEESDGAGNYYGLYWFYGKENSEPVVCWFEHEQSLIAVTHNCLDDFLLEFGYIESTGSVMVDYYSDFIRAKLKAQKGDLDNSVLQMNEYLNYVPENSEAWGILADVYRRKGNIEKADEMALKSILANWSFGYPTTKSIQQFKKIDKFGALKNDPLVKRIDEFELIVTYNQLTMNYDVVKQAIEEYYEDGDYINALILEHNYASMIGNETSTFQDKNGFDLDVWREQYRLKCEKYLNRSFTTFNETYHFNKISETITNSSPPQIPLSKPLEN